MSRLDTSIPPRTAVGPGLSIALMACIALAGCLVNLEGELLSGWDGNTTVDTDGDGIPDDAPDNCPTTPNRSQADFDGDQTGNACDVDTAGQDVDGDGVDDSFDQCLGDTGGTNEDDDVYPDIPWQIVDACDSCPSVPNPDQSNADGDDVGDLCEHPLGMDIHANIVMFDGLRNDLMGWRILDHAGWSFLAGALVADPVTILNAVVPDTVGDRLTTRYGMEAVFEMDTPGADTDFFGGVLLATKLDTARTQLVAWQGCVLSVDDGSRIVLSIRALAETCSDGSCKLGEILREYATGIVAEPGAIYRLLASRDGNSIACFLGPNAGQVDAQISLTTSSMSNGGPGLTAAGTTTSFSSATVYGP